MKKLEKKLFVENLTEELIIAKSIVLIDYSGLSVKAQQELKKRLKDVGGRLIVVKNTLLKLAGKAAKLSNEILTDKVLSGPTALIISDEDPLSPLQILYKFSQEKGVLNLKVGIIENAFYDKESITKIASLPGREVLLGQLLGSLTEPKYQLVGTLNSNLQKLLYILKEVSKNGS